MSDVTFKKLPGVLSFQRGFVISDGLFYNLYADGSDTKPVFVIRHGIRGTQNVNTDNDKDVSNVQITETAKSDGSATGIKVSFSMRVLPLSQTLFACAGTDSRDIRDALNSFVERALPSEGLQEVARRYARNVLNGRWLWRNPILGDTIAASVTDGNGTTIECGATQSPMKDFDNYSEQEKNLGHMFADNMIGGNLTAWTVDAVINFGFAGAVELFPSQNYVENKPKGFARPLYKIGHPEYRENDSLDVFKDTRVMGMAALRDQKIGNAIRTIDTWYASYKTHGKPIPVEPNGASLDAQQFFRREGADRRTSAFELMKRINQVDPNSHEGMFMIASLMRGGVFSEGEKKDKNKNKDDNQES